MSVNNSFSRFKPEIWPIKSEIIRQKAMEINERIEAVIDKSEIQSDSDDDEDDHESKELEQKMNSINPVVENNLIT